jgi:hypothetical protein
MEEVTVRAPAPGLFEVLRMPPGADLESLPIPAPGTPYFVVGADKRYIHKTSHWGRVLVPMDKLPFDNAKETGFLWYGGAPAIPPGLLGQIWSFFKQVYENIGTEAMIYLTFKDGQYGVFVPPQITSGGHVNAQFKVEQATKNGAMVIGTIHSHCNFGAFHSGTDTHDADGMDGLHITIGKVLHDQPEYAVMVSYNKIRWELKLDEITNGIPNLVAHPAWWHRYVAKDNGATTNAPIGWVGPVKPAHTTVTYGAGYSNNGVQSNYGTPNWGTTSGALPYGWFHSADAALRHLQRTKKPYYDADIEFVADEVNELEDQMLDLVAQLEVFGVSAAVKFQADLPWPLERKDTKLPIHLEDLTDVAEAMRVKHFMPPIGVIEAGTPPPTTKKKKKDRTPKPTQAERPMLLTGGLD